MREWLKKIRNEKGFTQEYTAGKLGMSRVSYVNMENGKRMQNLELIIADKLSQLFEIPLSEISKNEKKN